MSDAPARTLFSRPLPALALIAVGIAADQASKIWVETSLPFEVGVPVAPFLAFYRTYNEGIAFSMLSDQSGLMIVVMRLVIVAAVIWWWRRSIQAGFLLHLGFALIVAGALGNLIDRFLYGHVVDFILVYTENMVLCRVQLADSMITTGAVSVGLYELFLARSEQREDTETATKSDRPTQRATALETSLKHLWQSFFNAFC